MLVLAHSVEQLHVGKGGEGTLAATVGEGQHRAQEIGRRRLVDLVRTLKTLPQSQLERAEGQLPIGIEVVAMSLFRTVTGAAQVGVTRSQTQLPVQTPIEFARGQRVADSIPLLIRSKILFDQIVNRLV